MTQKEKHVIYLALCISRIIFLFGDYILSNTNIADKTDSNTISDNNTAKEFTPSDQYQLQKNIKSDINDMGIDQTQMDKIQVSDIQKTDLDASDNFDEIQSLKIVYNKTQNTDVLNLLLEKLIKNYQFDDAKAYIFAIDNGNYSKKIDVNIYLHILINSLSVINPNEISDFENQLNMLYQDGYISQDDAYFYMGLIKIRNKNFDQATQIFKKIKSPRYNTFIQSYLASISKFPMKTDIPGYYKDGLISLTMLKNGYFSIAKKLALSISIQNEKYILPYQILAYSHFLTNDREPAIEYFFKLIDINQDKEENYKFLIGVGYYRDEKYEESVIYLSQVKGEIYQTDVHRYLILNYIAANDETKLIRMRQSILGQNNLEKSDFYTFFYNVFYRPFRKQELFVIYNNNPQLSTSFLEKCYQTFSSGNDDICIYGQAGRDIASSNRAGAKDKLLYIAERYPQAYIFHALGDYHFKQNEVQQSKEYYLKAIGMTSDEIEKNIIRKKLIE